MLIRLENEQDFAAIYSFTKEAFKTAKVKDGNEQDFVERLRKSEDYLPSLAFVAEENNEIIGHVMLTKVRIKGENQIFEELILAPLTVRLDQRNKGLGSQLMNKAEQAAISQGYQAIVLIGDPQYYGRFGYTRAEQFGIVSDSGIPSDYLLIKKIGQTELANIAGTVSIPE
ncbi:GNAT family N-acetyltransferase [Enterococcus sp. 5H]|uniref:GNAT family N-acetyltransferase n=1 Tax=Enterococcus sp. 5H TaxID=1229490 RepID=UPI002302E8C0|nr:N-acetyltransferase [Enterococcus sp. 5H]MDA9470125.1 GCN5-related N-acetyltransferase [Enterococcus sp. 5H]